MIQKILIANRGEIACRIARTVSSMGMQTVAVYSNIDEGSLHVASCDEAVNIGNSPATESYLNIDSIIQAARATGSDAIHPGYGFLSENAAFAKACLKAGIIFIGPSVSNIESMGSKAVSKELMSNAKIPVVPGYHGVEQALEYLKLKADEIGYPVLIKASAGGGGRGMRLVCSEKNIEESIQSAQMEAKAAFADDRLLIEKYIKRPRHVEVQVFGDNFGNVVHLFERDCSIQRRHQKVIEEAPAPKIDSATRSALLETAVAVAKAINYQGAGTVEFVLNDDEFYFIEMNTRLQVEHSVTELITGIDLVEWQIKVANGEPVPLGQNEIFQNGHAFEARLYAEDPNDFRPQTGVISHLVLPHSNSRIDTGVRQGDTVSVYYDPMIAKLSVHGTSRSEALKYLNFAIRGIEIGGLVSNQPFLKRVIEHKDFIEGSVDTNFIEQNAKQLLESDVSVSDDFIILAAVTVLQKRIRMGQKKLISSEVSSPWTVKNGWRLNARNVHRVIISDGTSEYNVLLSGANETYEVVEPFLGKKIRLLVDWHDENYCTVNQNQNKKIVRTNVFFDKNIATFFSSNGAVEIAWGDDFESKADVNEMESSLKAPMPGKIMSIMKFDGDRIRRGETLLVLEAMKMQHSILAPSDGIVNEMYFVEGDLVNEGDELLDFEPDSGD
jgi:3-methylcrotonyl-CoA carboxylase alpha subunit